MCYQLGGSFSFCDVAVCTCLLLVLTFSFFLAAAGSSLVGLQAFSAWNERELLFVAEHGLPIVVASLVEELRLWVLRLQ